MILVILWKTFVPLRRSRAAALASGATACSAVCRDARAAESALAEILPCAPVASNRLRQLLVERERATQRSPTGARRQRFRHKRLQRGRQAVRLLRRRSLCFFRFVGQRFLRRRRIAQRRA